MFKNAFQYCAQSTPEIRIEIAYQAFQGVLEQAELKGFQGRRFKCASSQFFIEYGTISFVVTNNVDTKMDIDTVKRCFNSHFVNFTEDDSSSSTASGKNGGLTDNKGLGMGLYIAANMVRMMGK